MKSNLQIISGKYRGKKLNLPPDARPTQNMARAALFNMLNEIIDSSKQISVWDAFGGSGAFGIECLSRYNQPMVVFTDVSNSSIETLKKNLISINENATIERTDALAAISRFGGIADLIFIDPPYAEFDLGGAFVRKMSNIAKSGTVLIWEFEDSNPTPKINENWEILKDKKYGRARFLIIRKK